MWKWIIIILVIAWYFLHKVSTVSASTGQPSESTLTGIPSGGGISAYTPTVAPASGLSFSAPAPVSYSSAIKAGVTGTLAHMGTSAPTPTALPTSPMIMNRINATPVNSGTSIGYASVRTPSRPIPAFTDSRIFNFKRYLV